MRHDRSSVDRWALAAGLCLSIGCVQGRCYQNVDCPASQVCVAGGVCVSPDASIATSRPAPLDAGAESAAWRPADTNADADADAEADAGPAVDAASLPGCPPHMAAIGNFCIDLYEASRGDATATGVGGDGSRAYSAAGVLPWQVGSNAEAAAGCAAAG